ncbi:hypothetical protein Q8F55_004601 [Vanrija albida]|uniref:Uncharacterized protein n=1 Tax=Vanrija albida TaxID=181172 RepID=A0ABR3Q7Y7_9TREE
MQLTYKFLLVAVVAMAAVMAAPAVGSTEVSAEHGHEKRLIILLTLLGFLKCRVWSYGCPGYAPPPVYVPYPVPGCGVCGPDYGPGGPGPHGPGYHH